ncbi:MAG: FHA domain-containing protein [Candidatus Brocadiia bacterium]
MEQLLDFIFGIRWWQWLVGMSCVAGLYYLFAAVVLPFLRGVQVEHLEEVERQKEEEEEQRRQEERERREAERREYLKRIPSGPLEQVDLPRAAVRVRNQLFPVAPDAETSFGTRRDCSVRIMARGVSRLHAKIRPERRGYVLYDLMSEAGTFAGGRKIQSKVLADGDRFKLGPVQAIFALEGPSADR